MGDIWRSASPPPHSRLLPHILFLCVFAAPVRSQNGAPSPTSPGASSNAPARAPVLDCNGVLLTYSLGNVEKIRPFTKNPANQPYKFEATAIVLNNGVSDLLSWALLVNFTHRELVVVAENAVLTDGSSLPYNTTGDAVTSFSGYPETDLKTPIETANDINQIQAKIALTGTLFGAGQRSEAPPLPGSLSLDDPSYDCLPFDNTIGSRMIATCCLPNPNFKPNGTSDADGNKTILNRPRGDLTILYDVIQAYPASYLARVTIENHSPLGRLDQWRLSWDWARDEFISKMQGAYPTVVDSSDCIFGRQGQEYMDLDFSNILNCHRSPVIFDLPRERYNDTVMGRIEHCCRNGTLLPRTMDPSQSVSAFQIEVYKMPPDLNRTALYPPKNFRIVGTLNPKYECGPPMRINLTNTPNPRGIDSDTLAIRSWQVACNISRATDTKRKCCVSYSAHYNDSVIPCPTCACGCLHKERVGPGCNTTAEALLLPPEALLLPFDNRTQKAKAWASIKHYNVLEPMPCGDHCGVSINWHISTDYAKGWSARVTLFNWGEVGFVDWFLAVRMDKVYPGYQQAYSFNGSALGNNTIFMQGLPGLNYLIGEVNGTNPDSDPRVPGKQQSVISFTKKTTPGINVIAGDGFPTKVFFNGEECALPKVIPTHNGVLNVAVSPLSFALILIASVLFLLEL